MNDVIIRFSHVSKSFGKLKVLNDFSFEVKRGEKILIFGPTGIGKTTILKMTAGILKADEGFVEVKGTVGYVFQEPRLLPWKTAVENINLVLSDREKAMEWLNRVGLDGFENYYPNSLSGGMKQKVALARALAVEPEILLLDEPLTGLDFKAKDEILHLLRKFLNVNGSTVVYVTHNMKEVSNFTDKILVLPYSNGSERGGKDMNKYRINTGINDWCFNASQNTYFSMDVNDAFLQSYFKLRKKTKLIERR